jgi:fucose 4-O-acetylase-like acetyltransferase
MKERIEYIDLAKAVGILLVILGHCVTTAKIPHLGVAIYSFHMPLFFIISGMFIKPLNLKESVAKFAKAYLKPYVILSVLLLLITLIFSVFQFVEKEEIMTDIIRIAFGSGSNEDNALLHDVPTIGPIWFLLALFWGCLFTSVIKKYSNSIVDIILWGFSLFFLGYISAKSIRLPFSLQAGLCSIPFLLIGSLINNHKIIDHLEKSSKVIVIFVVLIWLYVILSTDGELNMASCRFNEGIVRVPISIFITVFCLSLCKKNEFRALVWLKWLGRNTLYVLAGHQIYKFFFMIVPINSCITILPPPYCLL